MKLAALLPKQRAKRDNLWRRFHVDWPLLLGLCALVGLGLLVLYSAANKNLPVVERQIARMILAFVTLFFFAQVSPQRLQIVTPWFFGLCILLLMAVLLVGHTGKGATRWLNLGLFRFQPSELIKLGLPMMLAWYLHNKTLPPSLGQLCVCALIIAAPVLLTAKQPDLGTALMIAASGFFILLLAGMSWRLIIGLSSIAIACTPLLWHFMHNYQRQRVLTFLNPERDPLGAGYHIIQSKIAIGSGGLFGKGWLNGTQSHLHFLPEHSTDFIFAVSGEEFGFLGALLLISVYLCIVARSAYISVQAQDTFTRLLGGSLCLTFFVSAFINIGMVTGILPVVGLPLPLVSYGGTSMVMVMASFGILMSIQTHKSWNKK